MRVRETIRNKSWKKNNQQLFFCQIWVDDTKKNHQENSHLSHQRVGHFSRDSLVIPFDNERFCRHYFCIQILLY